MNMTRVNSLQDSLLQAVDTVVAQRLSAISFDKTISCTITDASNGKEGKYEVSDGSQYFIAYSEITTYRKNEQVYVTIPEGNYENRKFIIGKLSDENLNPYVYISPFDTILDMTNNLVSPGNYGPYNYFVNSSAKYTYNDVEYNLTDYLDFGTLPDDDDESESAEEIRNEIANDEKLAEKLCDSSLVHLMTLSKPKGESDTDKYWAGYERLGIRADFMTEIRNAIAGTYGLLIVVSGGALSTDTEDETAYFTFDSSMMVGNPYSFETYYQQEFVVDLSTVGFEYIETIDIYFYQKNNFIDIKHNPIAFTQQGFAKNEKNEYIQDDNDYYIPKCILKNDFKDTLLLPQISVNNLYVCLGEAVDDLQKDQVRLTTAQSSVYGIGKASKTIELRWAHLDETGNKFNMFNRKDDLGRYEVRWYRYSLEPAAADEFSSIYWDRIDPTDGLAVKLSDDGKTWLKNVYDTENGKYEPKNVLELLTNSFSTGQIALDLKKNTESFKVIIVEKNDDNSYKLVAQSNQLDFKNEQNVQEQTTTHSYNALNIEIEDGSYGQYPLYSQGGYIKDSTATDIVRTLSVKFDTNNDGIAESVLNDDNIVWTFPTSDTMLNVISDTDNDGKHQGSTLQYKIESHFYDSKNKNTISCTYKFQGVEYTTEVEFYFGIAGTMGSDITLRIGYVDSDRTSIYVGENQILYPQGNDKGYKLKLYAYDLDGKILSEIPKEGDIKWSWYRLPESSTEYTDLLEPISDDIVKININGPNNLFTTYPPLLILSASIVHTGRTITTYFPIALQYEPDIKYIDGTKEITYLTDGTLVYNKAAYDVSGSKENWQWGIISIEDIKTYNTFLKDDSDNTMKWYSNVNWSKATEEQSGLMKFLPELDKDNKLVPLSVYTENAPLFGIVLFKETDEGLTPMWIQPILVLRNQYPSTTINNWNGKRIELNEEEGYILSSGIAAGRKEDDDNTFSGVMLGDWHSIDGDNISTALHPTGVYGFNHGAMSYAFKDDGTAFIGKNGFGRIIFDGNHGVIQSGTWRDENYSSTRKEGGGSMKIDLDAPYLAMRHNDNIISLDATKISGQGNIKIENGNLKGTDQAPFRIGKKFCVDWDGSLFAQNASLTGTIYASGGEIGGWSIGGSTLTGADILLTSTANINLEEFNDDGSVSSITQTQSSSIKIGDYDYGHDYIWCEGKRNMYWDIPNGPRINTQVEKLVYKKIGVGDDEKEYNYWAKEYGDKLYYSVGIGVYKKAEYFVPNATYYEQTTGSRTEVKNCLITKGPMLDLQNGVLRGRDAFLDGAIQFFNQRGTEDDSDGTKNNRIRKYGGWVGSIGYLTAESCDVSTKTTSWNTVYGPSLNTPGFGMLTTSNDGTLLNMVKMYNNGVIISSETGTKYNSSTTDLRIEVIGTVEKGDPAIVIGYYGKGIGIIHGIQIDSRGVFKVQWNGEQTGTTTLTPL